MDIFLRHLPNVFLGLVTLVPAWVTTKNSRLLVHRLAPHLHGLGSYARVAFSLIGSKVLLSHTLITGVLALPRRADRGPRRK
jgi:hypothetical protein